MPKPILFVLTSHAQLGDSGKFTGFHFEETTTPYYVFTDAGFDVELASIRGGRPPHDPGSLKDNPDDNPASVKRFICDSQAMHKLESTRAVSVLKAEDYNAIYLPGGHGTMWDFPQSHELGELISEFFREDKPVAAVCHGAAGLIGAHDRMQMPIVKSRRINCFTNEEEIAVGKKDVVPFLLETALRELDAKFEMSGKFQPHVAQDDNLITGQNPASAEGVARAVLGQLQKQASKAA